MQQIAKDQVSRQARIQSILSGTLAPRALNIKDTSASHSGHAGVHPGGETHFSITIDAPQLAGVKRLERHRMINTLLASEFETGLHALSITFIDPPETCDAKSS